MSMQITDPFNTAHVPITARPHWNIAIPAANGSASVAVAVGDLLALVWDEATETIVVALADTDTHDPAMKVAVAAEAIAAGVNNAGLVIIKGFARVNIGTGAVNAGERLIMTATAGEADGVVADANTIEGDTHGVFLGNEIGTSNKAPVWLN